MSKAYECDRCGEVYRGSREARIAVDSKDKVLKDKILVGSLNKSPELCQSCLESLKQWFNMDDG